MPVTLAQARLNTQDDLDMMVIDEFRRSSALVDNLVFHDAVNPSGGGSTLTYGYHRVQTPRSAAFRAINTEYTPAEATKVRHTVDLKPLGGSFEIDRVLAQVAAGAEVAFQMEQLIRATTQKFNDEVINGDTAVDANGFDGLNKALTGSSTEYDPGSVDWTNLDAGYHSALDHLDTFLSLLDGPATMIMANSRAIAKIVAIARRANQYVERPVDNLTGPMGQPIVRQFYGSTLLVDLGDKPGTANPIIPIDPSEGTTDIYAVRVGLDGFHGVSVSGQPLVNTWLPDFSEAGAVKKGEVEMGPVAVALKATKAAAVFRGVKVQ